MTPLSPLIFAHGVGGRSDLPLPAWLFAYGAGFAVVISFVALGILWPKPRLAAASVGRELPGWVQWLKTPVAVLLRAVGLFVYGVILVACLWGVNNSASNLAPYVVYVTFWVGMQLLQTFVGDAWRALNPLDTIALVVFGRRLPERTDRADPGLWPAAVMIASFAWLELAYFDPSSPRALAVWFVGYSVAALAGAVLWGRTWLRLGEGFAALFHLLAAMAPLFRDDETGRIRSRWPLTGLARVRPQRGLDALILTVLGSTTFDGLTRLDWWTRDVVGARTGWSRSAVYTIGMAFTIGVVALVWNGATRLSARITGDDQHEVADAYLPSLVPIVIAYAIAHYFSLFVYETYDVIALASDPFGRGWDLFGTIDVEIDYSVLTTTKIAWVQAGAIVVGHVSGVVAAHDRAVERHRSPKVAGRSQWPLVGAMVLYTVGGLGLLLGA